MTGAVIAAGIVGCCIIAADTKAESQPPEADGLYGFHDKPSSKALKWVKDPAPEAVRLIGLIIDGVGIAQNFEVWAGDFRIRNLAMAAVTSDKRRHIIYDVDDFRFSNGRARWPDVGLLAHEIGHHLATHITGLEIDRDTSHAHELEADRFAGVAVARLGGTLEQALSWTAMLSVEASDSHPGRARRIAAVTEGWHHGEAMKRREAPVCKTDWAGKPVNIEGRNCRIARRCNAGKENYALACRDLDGAWRWSGK